MMLIFPELISQRLHFECLLIRWVYQSQLQFLAYDVNSYGYLFFRRLICPAFLFFWLVAYLGSALQHVRL